MMNVNEVNIESVIDEKPSIQFIEGKHENNANDKITWRQSIRQIIACVLSCCLVIQVGTNMSFSAILLPQLAEKHSQFTISTDEASWIASIVAIALPFGCFLIGPLMDAYGRKTLCIFTAIPYTVAWLIQENATHVWHIYIARILSGISGGFTTVVIVYIAEISHPAMRQILLSMNSVFVSFGILLTYFFGMLIRWQATAILFSVITALTGLVTVLLPESPYWLVVFKHDYQSAQRALKWIYNDDPALYELQYKNLVETKRIERDRKLSTVEIIKEQLKLYKESSVYKPTVVLALVFLFQQLSGAYVIIFYAIDLYRKIGRVDQGEDEAKMDEFSALVLIGVLRLTVSIISAAISKSFGRRILLFTSCFGMSFCSFCAGLYIYLTMLPADSLPMDAGSARTDNIAFYFLLGYVSFGSLGFLVIPWTLIGEMLPVKVRGTLGGALVAFAYILMSLLVKIFPAVLSTLDIHCLFYILSIVNLFAVTFVYFFLPETLGKTFSEIEQYFKNDR